MLKYKPKTKPFPHQGKATLQALRARNLAIFMEPRTGKTKVAIDYVGILFAKGEVSRVLVLCPLIAIDVWIDQLRQHAPYPYAWETADESSSIVRPRDRSWSHINYVHYYFLNYEKASRRVRRKGGSYSRPYLDEVETFNPDVVVCDESHRLKRAGGVASQAVWRMVRRLRERSARLGRVRRPYVLLLTGTPNPKGWIDLFAQFRVMDETIFGTTKADFEEEYCTYGKGSRRYTIVKYRRTSVLLRKVRDHSISVTAEQAGLAGKQFTQNLWYDLPPEARRIYNDMAENFIAELEGSENGRTIAASNPGVKRLRLLQIAGGFPTEGGAIHGVGIATVKAYLSDLFSQNESAVVYVRFLAELLSLRKAAEDIGFQVGVLAGSVARDDRTRALRSFQRERSPQALVCQVQVGSLSIELSSAAEAIFYSLPDGWDVYKQCRDRLGGPNQKRPVRYTHVLARSTVHPSVLRSLRRKQDWHNELMRDPRAYLYGTTTL